MKYSVPFYIFLLAQTSWVVSFTLSRLNLMQDQLTVFIAGVITLSIVTIVPYLLFRKLFNKVDPFVLILAVFSWSCMIDLGIGLELDGLISNFMGFYFIEGEPYLNTSHGAVISYWDGIVHFILGLAIISLYCQRQSYRTFGLYWAGSILNSMVVLIPGGIAGNHPFKLSILLNIPYLILPLLAGFKLLHDRPIMSTTIQKFKPIWERPVDAFFFLYFIIAIFLSLFRGLAVLGGNAEAMKEYIHTIEPYLADETNFPKFQMIVYGYFFLAYYLGAAYALIFPGQAWMADWSLIHAGAAAQAQFAHIAGSFHHRTSESLRPPQNGFPALTYWFINLLLFIVPQLFAWWCQKDAAKFGLTSSGKKLKLNKILKTNKTN